MNIKTIINIILSVALSTFILNKAHATNSSNPNSTKKTYTFFLNYLNGSDKSIPSLKNINVSDIINNKSYLTKSTVKLQKGKKVYGKLVPWEYKWARKEDKSSSSLSKKDHRFKVIVRPRATVKSIPEVVDGANRVVFKYWDYIDSFIFWGGSASEGTIVAPDPKWITDAHIRGVKIYGTVFLPPLEYGGSTNDCKDFNIDIALKLTKLAKELNFEGWFINAESFANVKTGRDTCINNIDNALSDSIVKQELLGSGISFLKYIGASPHTGWISDANIYNIDDSIAKRRFYGTSEDGVPFKPGDFFLKKNIRVHPKEFLMFANTFYFNALDSTKLKVKDNLFTNVSISSDHLWEGLSGLNKDGVYKCAGSDKTCTWNGIAQYTKKRMSPPPAIIYASLHSGVAQNGRSFPLKTIGAAYNVDEIKSSINPEMIRSIKIIEKGISVKACDGINLTGKCYLYSKNIRLRYSPSNLNNIKSYSVEYRPFYPITLYSDIDYNERYGLATLPSMYKTYNLDDFKTINIYDFSSIKVRNNINNKGKTLHLKPSLLACTKPDLNGVCDKITHSTPRLKGKYYSFMVQDYSEAPYLYYVKLHSYEGAEDRLNVDVTYDYDSLRVGDRSIKAKLLDDGNKNIELKACTKVNLEGKCNLFNKKNFKQANWPVDTYKSFIVKQHPKAYDFSYIKIHDNHYINAKVMRDFILLFKKWYPYAFRNIKVPPIPSEIVATFYTNRNIQKLSSTYSDSRKYKSIDIKISRRGRGNRQLKACLDDAMKDCDIFIENTKQVMYEKNGYKYAVLEDRDPKITENQVTDRKRIAYLVQIEDYSLERRRQQLKRKYPFWKNWSYPPKYSASFK